MVVELWRGGKLVAHSKPVRVERSARKVVLRRHRGARFSPGHYKLVVRQGERALLRRPVRIAR